jgi:hypothetical protein
MPLDFIKLCRDQHIAFFDGAGNEHCRPGWVNVNCPMCSDSNAHLGWSRESGGFSCWHCGVLHFWNVVPALLRTSKSTAKTILRPYWTHRNALQPRSRPKRVVRPSDLAPPPGCGPMAKQHITYLEGRGFDADALAEEWGLLGTNHLGGIWAWRIIIPVRNESGRIVAYQGRSIGDAQPKYKLTDDADCLEDPDAIMFGIDKVPGDTVLIVEGATGVFRIGPSTVATLGIKWRHGQLHRLRKYKRRFIMFDPEKEAQFQANTLAMNLAEFPGETFLLDGHGRQPGEFSAEKVKLLRKKIGLAF